MTVALEKWYSYRFWSKNTLLTILVFIIFPLAAVPFIIKGMLRNKRWAFVLWAIFMGLLGILYPPTGDLYRYTQDFILIRDASWDDFKMFLLFKQDWLLPYLSYLLGRLGLNFDLSRFIYNFISYWLLGLIYLDIIKSNPAYSKKNAILFLGTFMVFSIGGYTIRFSASSVLFAYGAYLVVFKNKRCGWMFVVLSVLNHLSFIVFAVILFFCRLRIFYFSKKIVVLFVILSFAVDSSVMVKILSFMPVDIVNHYSIYLDGYWAGDFLKDHSFLYRLQMLLISLISYAAAIIYILTYNIKYKTIAIVNGVLLLTTLVTPFATIATRFTGVLLLFIKMHFLNIYKDSATFHKTLLILFYLSLFSNLMGLWGARRQLGVSDIKKIVYCSLPQILCHTYTEYWIDSTVFENGDFKHN